MGHRVWSQRLDHPELSIETECACKHLHGHSYEAKVFVGANELDDTQMVVDFKNLNFMKKFLDEELDHKFMVDVNDPNFDIITGMSDNLAETPNFTNLGELLPSDDDRVQLHRSSFVLVNFVPTSENICKYLKIYAQDRIGTVADVTAVELWETKKSHARYEG